MKAFDVITRRVRAAAPALMLALASIAVSLPALRPAQAQGDVPVIAAAADLQFAITEIAEAFKAETGQTVKLSFGSTGNFATQIRKGAPFQVFMAADEKFVAALHREGLTRDEGAIYAEGRIVLMAPHGSSLTVDPEMNGLVQALDAGKITRFAIAHPGHAPYGQRAEEALRRRQIWDRLQRFMVLGENVSQAAQFALSGNAEGGIIAYSLALAPAIKVLGTYSLIPADWHAPLLQRMVLLKNAGPVAEQFYAYVNSPKARDIMTRYGFVLPKTP